MIENIPICNSIHSFTLSRFNAI